MDIIDYDTFKNLPEEEQEKIWAELLRKNGIEPEEFFDLDFDNDPEEDDIHYDPDRARKAGTYWYDKINTDTSCGGGC